MVLCYSKASMPSAIKIANESDDIRIVRGSKGDVNWGRERANTLLNPDISNCTNKRVMRELFRDNDVPMPYLVDGWISVNWPIVGRPDEHTRGRGFWLCYNQ